MTQTNTSMNFLPDDYVEKRQANRAAWVFIGLLLAVVGGIVGAYLYTQWKMHGVFAERDRVNVAYDDASKKIAQAQELEQQKERLIQKADTITALMEKVKGSAPTDADVAAYMTALQKSPLLDGVSLTYSEEFKKEKDNITMRRFNIEMRINPDADLRTGGSVVTATPKN